MSDRTESIIKWKIDIKLRTAVQIEHRLMDPMTRKPKYGMRTKLVNALLERYLTENPTAIDSPPITEEEIASIIGVSSV